MRGKRKETVTVMDCSMTARSTLQLCLGWTGASAGSLISTRVSYVGACLCTIVVRTEGGGLMLKGCVMVR